METTRYVQVVTLSPENNTFLLNLCGKLDEHIRLIADQFKVDIKQRGFAFSVSGESYAVKNASYALSALYYQAQKQPLLTPHQIHLYLQTISKETHLSSDQPREKSMDIRLRRATITARGENQVKYIQHILDNDINFGIGPAGTGKTYLAVACAVHALETERVNRIVLVRPIVEAGEKLGFLPGDLQQKIHPYLKPLYDALYEMLGFDTVNQLTERNIIEMAPLAYMRGRTLSDSFIILDESQNTTTEQMKMFLTRIGFNSKAVITGDITQIDLQNHRDSGLIHTLEVLDGVKGISFTQFKSTDVVRHPLVQSIVEAYERHHDNQKKSG